MDGLSITPAAGRNLTGKKLGLSASEKAVRRHSIGGSDANTIIHGTPEMVERLWREKRGEIIPLSASEQDIDSSLPAAMGQWTEELNRRWFTKLTGREITSVGKRCQHPEIKWLTATLDGLVDDQAVFEAKHLNPFDFDPELVVAKYMPQLQHNMFVVGADRAVLSVFVGNTGYRHWWVDFDPFYHADLLRAERRFWQAVKTGNNPSGWDIPVIDTPSKIDMTANPLWCSLATRYRAAAGEMKSTTEQLRALIPPRAREARGAGVVIKRDKRGTPRVTETEEA